jgi:amino acid adenylation domain-containing protein
MTKKDIEAIYSLSPMQQGMLFHSLYAPASGMYVEQMSCVVEGGLNVPAFERAWGQVVARHSILRTAFTWKRLDKMLQVAHRQVEAPLAQYDWRDLSPAEQQAQLNDFLRKQRAQGFDLSRAPLMRLALMRTGDDAYYFVWCHHHLLLDGWSLPLILKEVLTFYEANCRGQAAQLEPAKPYRNYINWLEKQDLSQAESFWRETLKNFTAPTPLVVDRLSAPEAEYAELETQLSTETTAALHALARQNQLTLNTLAQGAWALLLSRYSCEEDVVFGATVSGRPAELPGAETMVGLFINTLPVRVRVPFEASVTSWLKDLQAQQVELRQFEYSPLVQIQEWSEVPRGTPLFESILVFENYPVDASLRELNGSLKFHDIHSIEQTNYPLTVVSGPGAQLPLKIAYDGRRFSAGTIRRMLGHLQTLLEGMAANPDGQLGSLPLLTNAEQRQLLIEWNDTAAEFPAGCIHHLFESQVERTPDALAVVFEDQRLTYAKLNQRANQLAHHLQTLGVKAETLVGICLERSPEMIVSVLAVLKAGGAYLPLDPTYPPERLAFMLADSQTPILLTHSSLLAQLPPHPATTVCLDSDWPIIAEHPITNYQLPITLDNLAYVIYTSGSTGKPKGTLLPHRGLSNLIHAFAPALGLTGESRVLQFASFSFDASVFEIFMALTAGAALHLARQETLSSVSDLTGLLQEQVITTITLPPSLLALLSPEELPALQTIISAGEACPVEVAARWSVGRRLFNGYGPTEATVGASFYAAAGLSQNAATVPIGRPLANTEFYILDSHLRPVPVGVPGELHIGGLGLARGYLNRPELTAEKFIAIRELENSPIPQSPRLYKTGDLCRYLPDGNLEFLGRIDQQVKVRGFRIELGEIEAALAQHPALQAVAVIARDDERGEKYLAAYIVPKSEPAPGVDELRRHLQATLPAYMIPSVFVTLTELPRLPNGKVNRKALPAPDRAGLEAAYLAPRTPTEEILAGLWARVLNLERVGIHDNFFELGGHSLKATQLVSRVREAFNVELPIRALFESPTVAGLAAHLEAAQQTVAAPPITSVPRDEALPLSFAQQRLWFLDQLVPGSPLYNIPLAMRLTGALDVAALERTLNEIVSRHEVLRTTFATADGRPAQVIAPNLVLPLPVTDLSHLPEGEREALARQMATDDARRPFDLAGGPLLRARLLHLADDDHVALLTLHHIISDGWSMGVLIREIAALYDSFSTGKRPQLPNLPLQYADFAAWQRGWLQGDVLEAQLAYWKEQLGDSPPLLELPTDRPRPAVQTNHGAHHTFALPADLTNAIKALTQKEGVTLFMTLLAAFQTLLHRYTGQNDLNVGAPIANRSRAEVENLIGFFVNTLVLRARFDGQPTFRDLLKRARETALAAYAHQDLPFEMLVEALQPQRDLSHTPLFQAMFVLDNAPMGTFTQALPGLTLSPIEAESGIAKFDITLSMFEGPNGLQGTLEYNTDLFDAATIERLAGHFKTLLAAVTANPDQPLTALPLLTDAERHTMLVAWNNTTAPFPNDLCFHQLFEAHAHLQPDATALTFENESLTYSQLNERANQLAHHLLSLGLQPDTLVAIAADRSFDMIIAVLAALKAGGAFLPLDPAYPPDRLAFMLHDSQAPVLLTQAHLLERLPQHAATALCLDADWPAIANSLISNPHAPLSPENLAYCIYTSGSTGQPKGTLLRHRGLSNLATVQRQAFQLGPASRVLQFSPFSFDASVWEIAMSLGNGATLSLAPQEVLASGPDLLKLLRDQAITTVTLPPSMLNVLTPEALPDLHTIISAGEACSRELVQRWATGRQFFDAYGPTETTVCASMALCDPDDEREPSIGKPIANFQLFILDPHQQPVPIGVPGELHIGGVGLARGYLNRPELTAEKFIEIRELENSPILYKTGDLCRFRPDGNIEFLGRIDGQVKVRGFRIELGEVESVLKGHPAVQDGAVLARDNRLVAYVVAQAEAAAPASDLRAFLRQRLPEYMVPSAFVVLPVLPLSPSGKVDRKALAALDVGRAEERPYVAPRTETETRLARLCAELLELERVGVDDNFFELGGHSLLATQFVSRVREAFGIELPLRALFEHPSIAELAEAVDGMTAARRVDESKVVSLLHQIDQLSDEDVKQMLKERRPPIQAGIGND